MSIPSFSIQGKSAIVTGARRGIGKAIALAFAEAGANVAVCDRVIEDGKLNAVAKEIQQLGRRSMAIQTDVTNKADVNKLVKSAEDEFGGIDILVNNAGTMVRKLLLELDEGDWDGVIDTNLKGYYLCCQAVGKRMASQGRGNIINMASTSAIKPRPYLGCYAISKAGVITLTRVLALELAQYNIRVNAIAPTLVRTELVQTLVSDPEFLTKHQAEVPLGRVAETGDIIGAALFLASDASSYITGHTMVVDGGIVA